MSLGQKVMNAFNEFIIDNSFFIVVLITMVLFALDFYNRYLRINKETDHINLVERYVWLEYYRSKVKKGSNV